MKRSTKLYLSFATILATSLLVTPAFAQDYSNPGGPTGAAGGAFAIAWLCCFGLIGIIGLVLFGLWIWMLIDAFGRMEYEFPNSTGNSKNLWLIILIVSFFVSLYWLAALLYYFMVYKKIKRGTAAPAWAQATQPPAAPMAPPAPPVSPMAPPAPPAPPTSSEMPAPPAPEMPAPPAPPEAPAPPSEGGDTPLR